MERTDKLLIGYLAASAFLLLVRGRQVAAWGWWLAGDLLAVLAIAAIARPHAERRLAGARLLHDWYPLALFLFCFEQAAAMSQIFFGWQDSKLLRLEHWVFGVSPNLWLAHFKSIWLLELLEAGYFSYFLLLPWLGIVLYLRRDTAAFRRLMFASALSYVICYAAYVLFPAQGPRWTLALAEPALREGGLFHWLVLRLQSTAGVHGNAFPSAHVTNAVVCLLFAWRYARRHAWVMSPLVVLLCAGAVYDDYHYVSDVVAGIAVAGIVCASGRIWPWSCHRAIEHSYREHDGFTKDGSRGE